MILERFRIDKAGDSQGWRTMTPCLDPCRHLLRQNDGLT